jgi:hypothetical protein
MAGRAALIAFVLAPLLAVQSQQQQANKNLEAKVEAAIRRGVEYLKQNPVGKGRGGNQLRELILLALVHSGVRPSDPVFAAMLRDMLEEDLAMTYRVALQAMVLEELDRVRYQKRIFQCAQFLVDNQAANGMWSYGQPTTYPEPATPSWKDVATGPATIQPGQVVMFGDPHPGEKPPVKHKIQVQKQRDFGRGGDNSNSQYAALGLRACHDAGIILPRDGVEKAQKWWHDSQCDHGAAAQGNATPGGAGPSRGWSYSMKGSPYGSMTAGAVAALSICDYILGVDWKKDEHLTAGNNWLRDNFSVTENPGRKQNHHYYYLYGLERAGMLYGIETYGKREWYAEGAQYLVDNQGGDGQWGGSLDTCFAILFLRRATRSLVESKDNSRPMK